MRIDRMSFAAADDKERHDRGPKDRFLGPTIPLAQCDPVKPDSDQENDGRRYRSWSREEAQGNQQPGANSVAASSGDQSTPG